MSYIKNKWGEILLPEFQKDYFQKLIVFVRGEYASKRIYPRGAHIFEAFELCDYDNVKVVILGQDPYYNPNQAHGLAFSVGNNPYLPGSLKNIYKELHEDLNIPVSSSGDLTRWAKQGVLLLNTILTVEQKKPLSHKGRGWETFTDEVIRIINRKSDPVVFMLWGNNAISKRALITNPNHLVLCAPHPSPLSASRGFFGCRHFSKANTFLSENGVEPIKW